MLSSVAMLSVRIKPSIDEEATNRMIVKLPFPLTIKFKSMLQAGVQTKDMDPRWMSSISWYFLCIFGLQFVYVFLLGSENGKCSQRSI